MQIAPWNVCKKSRKTEFEKLFNPPDSIVERIAKRGVHSSPRKPDDGDGDHRNWPADNLVVIWAALWFQHHLVNLKVIASIDAPVSGRAEICFFAPTSIATTRLHRTSRRYATQRGSVTADSLDIQFNGLDARLGMALHRVDADYAFPPTPSPVDGRSAR